MKLDRAFKIVAAVVLVLGLLELSHSMKLKLLGLYVTGHSQCSFRDTMASMDSVYASFATQERIRQAMHLVRTDGPLELWNTPRGDMWMPIGQAKWMPLVLAEQEEKVYGEGLRGVHAGDIVLDCGAAMGEYTRTALDQGAAVVVAIEPAPEKEPCLRRNFAREIAEGRVIVYMKGVWDKDDWLELHSDSVVQQKKGQSEMVPLTTIDKLVAELKLPRVDLIKMDIEGAEKPALTGARETILKYHPRMSIATEHLPDDAVAIPRLVRSMAPSYQYECGPCEYAQGHIRPQVVFFF